MSGGDIWRLNDPRQPDSESYQQSTSHDVFLNFMEVRRQALLQELRFIEAELVTAGRIKRLTVAPPRTR